MPRNVDPWSSVTLKFSMANRPVSYSSINLTPGVITLPGFLWLTVAQEAEGFLVVAQQLTPQEPHVLIRQHCADYAAVAALLNEQPWVNYGSEKQWNLATAHCWTGAAERGHYIPGV